MNVPATAPSTRPIVSEEAVADFVADVRRLQATIQQLIIGQDEVVEETLVALFARGHVLLEGVPGLGKTLLVRTLAAALDLSFSRLQFTPDLMPSDITGTTILREDERGQRSFVFQPGPLFAHIVLADEVNRATPKTQSALLEAMQEGTVSVGNQTHNLPDPFFVLATQNPLEMEGTYPLPEAQLDRFLLKILVPFPGAESLRAIVQQTIGITKEAKVVLDGRRLHDMLLVPPAVPVATTIIDYAIALILNTHPASSQIDSVRRYGRAGASPRGLQALVTGAQVRSLLQGRYNISIDDLHALARPALRHRLLLNFEGEAEGISTDQLIDDVLSETPLP